MERCNRKPRTESACRPTDQRLETTVTSLSHERGENRQQQKQTGVLSAMFALAAPHYAVQRNKVYPLVDAREQGRTFSHFPLPPLICAGRRSSVSAWVLLKQNKKHGANKKRVSSTGLLVLAEHVSAGSVLRSFRWRDERSPPFVDPL